MSRVAAWLERAGAHHDVVSWAQSHDDLEGAWTSCPRGDWLLGIAARLHLPNTLITRAAALCAREALSYVPDDEHRPRAAIEAAEAWSQRPGDAEAGAATAAAEAVEALTGASDGAVATAAHAALAAARSISEPELAPTAAAAAAQAAVLDAGDCAMMQALRFVQSRCADHVRAVIDASTVVAALDSVETR